jgi:hypothetical protein
MTDYRSVPCCVQDRCVETGGVIVVHKTIVVSRGVQRIPWIGWIPLFTRLMRRARAWCPGEPACYRPRYSFPSQSRYAISAFDNDPSRRYRGPDRPSPDTTRGSPPRSLPAGRRKRTRPLAGTRAIFLTFQCAGRSHRLKDCVAPPILSPGPGGPDQKIGSSACRSGSHFALLDPILDLPAAGSPPSR